MTAIDDLIAEWNEICRIEKDVHAAICAAEGDGKSHLMSQFILRLGGNLWDNVVYTGNPQEYYDKYDNLPDKYSVLGFDESLDLIDRINWAKTEVKDLVKHVRSRVRKEKQAIFLYAAQLFRDFHGFWRNHRIRYWIELPNREWFDDINMAFVYKNTRLPFLTGRRDVWLLDKLEKEWLDAMKKGAITGNPYLAKLKNHPFYVSDFKFKSLEEFNYNKYLRYRQEAYDTYHIDPTPQGLKDEAKQLKEENAKLSEMLNEFLSQKEIATSVKKSVGYINKQIQTARVMDKRNDRIDANKGLFYIRDSNRPTYMIK